MIPILVHPRTINMTFLVSSLVCLLSVIRHCISPRRGYICVERIGRVLLRRSSCGSITPTKLHSSKFTIQVGRIVGNFFPMGGPTQFRSRSVRFFTGDHRAVICAASLNLQNMTSIGTIYFSHTSVVTARVLTQTLRWALGMS